VGETFELEEIIQLQVTFSILERIDVGETNHATGQTPGLSRPFSILERIDVGETDDVKPLL